MNKPSLKKYITINFSKVELNDNEQFIVVTSAGVASGKPLLNGENALLPNYAQFLVDTVHEYRSNNGISEDEPLCGDDGFIVLTDVTLNASNLITHMPYLIVFTDQIVGISIGSFIK